VSSSLKQQTAKGLLWSGMSNGITQLLGVLFGLILLRLLTPSDYGKISVLIVFSGIAGNLSESGFIAALVNKKEPTQEEYNAVFWFSFFVSTGMYVLLWFLSPLIAKFYHEPMLTPLARYLFFGFWISSFGTVQYAYIFGHLKVKQNSIIGVVALSISGIVGITMAYLGFASWGLATQAITFVSCVVLGRWYVSPWHPSLHIHLSPAWGMLGFSSKLLLTNLFNQLNAQVFSILLGRYYDTKMVGYYSNARKWCDMSSLTINGMISSVAQPVLAQVKDSRERYQRIFRKMLRFVSFVSFPCMFCLGLIAKEFILIVVGEKWIQSALLLSMLSVYGAFVPVATLYSNMAISQGRSGVNMFCTIALCVVIWGGLILLHSYGVNCMVIFFVLMNMLWILVWQFFAKKIVGLPFSVVWKDIFPFLFITSIAVASAYWASRGVGNNYLSILIKVVVMWSIYIGLMYISKAKILRESLGYLLKIRKGNSPLEE